MPDIVSDQEKGDLRSIPKRKITEVEKQILALKIEKMKLEREKTLLILGGGVILFIGFIVIALIGLSNDLISKSQLNLMIIIGIIALIVGLSPYVKFVFREEKALKKTLEELIN